METASLSLAGCDCRPMGASPIETTIARRVFGYCVSKRRQELTELDSRDARASGSRRAIRCHVCLTSDRTACAVPLVLIAYGDAQFGWHAQEHGDRVAIACWLRLPSDGGKPHRNDDRSAFVSCRISKRARAWTGLIISRDARASGLKRATPCHVYSTSNRTACAEPL